MLALFAITGGVQRTPFVEEVFSTYLYTGNGGTQTITNEIDLAGEGGLVWLKSRSDATSHFLFDTLRGVLNEINSDTTDAQTSLAASLTAFSASGFSLGAAAGVNVNNSTYAAWTFRAQEKFFEIVTYTGTGANRLVPHALDAVPGCIMVKRTDTTGDWQVYHSGLANTQYMVLNTTAAVATGATRWNSTTPTSTEFSLGSSANVNAAGGTYVAYLFASNASSFGLTGTENVISCGVYAGNGSATGPVVTLGYEPQWLMIKNTTGIGDWQIIDNLRAMPVGATDATLQANIPNAEVAADYVSPTATGFQVVSASGQVNTSAANYIYVAVRRGPMAVPTVGTSVFGTRVRTGDDTRAPTITPTTAMVTDMTLTMNRSGGAGGSAGAGAVGGFVDFDRLRGDYRALYTISSNGQPGAGNQGFEFDRQNGIIGELLDPGAFFSYDTNLSGYSYINYFFRRAPSFFDEVCYTGTGANTTQAHNLTVVPELMIVKRTDTTADWAVYSSALANTEYLVLNTTAAKATGATWWNSATPTASVFSVGTSSTTNSSLGTYVAYLFATCLGVSKVGSYTGTATTKQIDCGFTAGARFVMIKRTDSTGDWYVWDTARGIIAGNDPYLLLNTNAAEVTSTDYVDTYAAGFELSSTAPAAINANGGTYIFLAIA